MTFTLGLFGGAPSFMDSSFDLHYTDSEDDSDDQAGQNPFNDKDDDMGMGEPSPPPRRHTRSSK